MNRTSAAPIVIGAHTFHCYKVGVLRYAYRSEDDRIMVKRGVGASRTYVALIDGKPIKTGDKAKRFHALVSAMKAAVKELD